MKAMFNQIPYFVAESNAIEGIHRDPTAAEIDATERFLALPELYVSSVEVLVGVYQPDAVIRSRDGMNVRVGDYVAPPGGVSIVRRLTALLQTVNQNLSDPWHVHVEYERLHPFTDGNGRSGRAVWLWQTMRAGGTRLSFLHAFYYQTLQNSR